MTTKLLCTPGLFVDGWQVKTSSSLELIGIRIRCSKPSVKLAGSDKSDKWLDFNINDSIGTISYYETEKYIHEISMAMKTGNNYDCGRENEYCKCTGDVYYGLQGSLDTLLGSDHLVLRNI